MIHHFAINDIKEMLQLSSCQSRIKVNYQQLQFCLCTVTMAVCESKESTEERLSEFGHRSACHMPRNNYNVLCITNVPEQVITCPGYDTKLPGGIRPTE